MVATDGDVEHCPYCGHDSLQGYWERDFDPEWIHVCNGCGERFVLDNKTYEET